jgi:hypothetical protein
MPPEKYKLLILSTRPVSRIKFASFEKASIHSRNFPSCSRILSQ